METKTKNIMKVISGGVDSVVAEKHCSFIIKTSLGDIKMYGEIINDEIDEKCITPCFWDNKYKQLSDKEQGLVRVLVIEELRKLI